MNENTLPEPLTPADCDLRDFQFMPLDVVRFAQSDLVALEEPAAVLANTLLWCASWHSIPAGSLTDDDRVLARLAGYGRGMESWLAIRDGALRGWVKCSDGRLYHPVVVEKALDAWEAKLKQRHRTLCATVRKHNERNPEDKVTAPDFEQWLSAGRPMEITRGRGGSSRVTSGNVTRDKMGMSHSERAQVTRKEPPLSRSSHAKNRSKGQGQGQGQGQGYNTSPSDSSNVGEMPSEPVAPAAPDSNPEPVLLPAVLDGPDDVEIAFQRHDAVRRDFVPNARAVELTSQRRTKLRARLKDIGGLERWDDALALIRASSFLRGETSRNGFVPTIDWLTEPKNLRKVMEGNYDNDQRAGSSRGSRAEPDVSRRSAAAIGDALALSGLMGYPTGDGV